MMGFVRPAQFHRAISVIDGAQPSVVGFTGDNSTSVCGGPRMNAMIRMGSPHSGHCKGYG